MEQQSIEARVTAEQSTVIEAEAGQKGIPIATWLRMMALEAANASNTQRRLVLENE